MEGIEVRKATGVDLRRIAETMADAFLDDPAFSWASPDRERRARHGPTYFQTLLSRVYLPKDEVHITSDGLAAALWAPPDGWQTSAGAMLALLPPMVRASRTKLPRVLRMVSLMEAHHKRQPEPHYYLPFIGTADRARGQGRGSALLAHMLERCDAEGRPAYLEATSPANRALYHRHGFEEVDELHWPGGGPPFWPMWRSPR